MGVEELYASVGSGSTNAQGVVNNFHQLQIRRKKFVERKNQQANDTSLEKKVVVDGGDNMLIKIATCCQPQVGDEIVGFVSQGRGLIIHKSTCEHVKYYDPQRLIEAHWA